MVSTQMIQEKQVAKVSVRQLKAAVLTKVEPQQQKQSRPMSLINAQIKQGVTLKPVAVTPLPDPDDMAPQISTFTETQGIARQEI
jgi:hypothetical protein